MSITRLARQLEESIEDQEFSESTSNVPGDRAGFPTGIPLGGATEENPGETPVGSVVDRKAYMAQLLQAYLACPWSSTAVDAIARTCTAGGCMVIPTSTVTSGDKHPSPPPGVEKVQNLLEFVNPQEDIRQLMRGVITDLMIFGDSFTEVVYAAGEPVALYPLDPITMTIESDEHGRVTGYKQTSETNRHASFEPHEIIHVKFDTPGNSLYGVSPTQKTILSITTWLFAKALIKDTMKRGDPVRMHVDWPMALSENERKKFQQQYNIRNLGARNIGNLFETKGGAQVRELGINQIDRWQNVIQQCRDEILSGYGVPPSKVGVIEAGNLGGGPGTAQDQAHPLGVLVPTLDGWTTIGELKAGDQIFDENGAPTTVEGVFERGVIPAWRIHFSDGASVDVGEDHLWTTWTAQDRKAYGRSADRKVGVPDNWPTWESKNGIGPKTRSTLEIVETLKAADGRNNHSIPVAGPLQLPEADLPISPYTLGAWLGDKTSSAREVAAGAADVEAIAELFRNDGTVVNRVSDAGRNVWKIFLGDPDGSFVRSLKENNLYKNKHIPAAYLRSSIEQRTALLHGLMDTDGGWTGGNQVVFVSTNERLADGVLELARSLGQKAVKAKRTAKLNGVETGPAFRITWTPTAQPFSLERKASLFKPNTYGQKAYHRTIVGAERLPDTEMRCIRVDSPNHLYLVEEAMIPTHNTFRVNTCGPIQEIVLEKFTFALLNRAFGITDWSIRFGVVDWRDDEVIEVIRDQRIRNGTWTLNKARADVGEPPVPGGDDPILVDRQNMVLWSDLKDLSSANLDAVKAQSEPINAPQFGKAPGGNTTTSAVLKDSGGSKAPEQPAPPKAEG